MIEILHLASFSGNVGDNANHNGTRKILRNTFNKKICFEELEIRRHYKNYDGKDPLVFDKNFTQKVNRKDLLLIGGGSFFNIWIDESCTGTTIDISYRQIKAMKTPVVFHGMGCILKKNKNLRNIRKFRLFLERITKLNHCLVSLRNDGSYERISKIVPKRVLEKIDVIPDGGFFLEGESGKFGNKIVDGGGTIGVNVVADLQKVRFSGKRDGYGYDGFLESIASCLDLYLESKKSRQVVFIPHIYSDLKAIHSVIAKMKECHKRKRVCSAPYFTGPGSEKRIFGVYSRVDAAIGMRFHANVCPIGIGVPTIGISSDHPKVQKLYESLGLEDRLISVFRDDLSVDLYAEIKKAINESKIISTRYKKVVDKNRQDLRSYHDKIKELVTAYNRVRSS